LPRPQFLVVADGEAVVSIGGKELARISPGGQFGEVALISDRVRTATVMAVTELPCYGPTLMTRQLCDPHKRRCVETPGCKDPVYFPHHDVQTTATAGS
jgi:hypothetical protein